MDVIHRMNGMARLVAAVLVLTACSSAGSRVDLPECREPSSIDCSTARLRVQQMRYGDMSIEHLVAASGRALGDLSFEVRRDDPAGLVFGHFVSDAPTHKGQLDLKFRNALGDWIARPISARVSVTADAQDRSHVLVRLQLTAAAQGPDGEAASRGTIVDRVLPYELFFQQLAFELGGEAIPESDDENTRAARDRQREQHKELPATVPSIPTGI